MWPVGRIRSSAPPRVARGVFRNSLLFFLFSWQHREEVSGGRSSHHFARASVCVPVLVHSGGGGGNVPAFFFFFAQQLLVGVLPTAYVVGIFVVPGAAKVG